MSCADDIRDNIGDERYFAIILKRIAEKKRKNEKWKFIKLIDGIKLQCTKLIYFMNMREI